MPRRTSEQAGETRERLLAAGRARFGESGFAATKATEVAERAGCTRGALLHHFVDKEGLFAAVLEELEEEVAATVATAGASGSGPIDALRQGFAAFLGECVRPEVTQIMLIDGPSVLGWDTWHTIDARYGYRPLLGVLRAAVAAGELRTDDPEIVAHLLLGALTEAATVVGRSEDPDTVCARMTVGLDRFIDALCVPRS